jgi:hypothetical protein
MHLHDAPRGKLRSNGSHEPFATSPSVSRRAMQSGVGKTTMTKNITAALFAVFIFAAIPTPASANPATAFGIGGDAGSGVGEGGPAYDYWEDLEEQLHYARARMRWLESKYPEEIGDYYNQLHENPSQASDAAQASDDVAFVQIDYWHLRLRIKNIIRKFRSRERSRK